MHYVIASTEANAPSSHPDLVFYSQLYDYWVQVGVASALSLASSNGHEGALQSLAVENRRPLRAGQSTEGVRQIALASLWDLKGVRQRTDGLRFNGINLIGRQG